ncbi:ThuA domain-containing protein [Robertkochia sediminum]|uniref:ThuA domain-containing protein n=1 Tax=Robertkochia sediminum TaxID=2785326 RepID=UPI0019339E6F|nr:ThuA domain-containing protein [Robertkochia sediminum]MBL7471843.1 ThuA domain-containing protein [Robertkochia sediminum]
MKAWIAVLVFYLFACAGDEATVPAGDHSGERVLVFTKTEGYRHGSISDGVSLIRRLGRKNGFAVDRTENAADFNEDELSKYDLVIFLSTTGDVLNQVQEKAFENYIENGGNFMGIHAAVDTEYDWPWYGALVGAYFRSHPKVQPAKLRIVDNTHPATSFLPDPWERTDEWYDLKDLKDDLRILITLDEDSYQGGRMGDFHPFAWCREFGDSRSFYTAGGHTGGAYKEPFFEKHILEGILWCLGRSQID